MKILLVEDNKKLSKYIRMALKVESYAVDAAYDGEEGVKRALYNEYDLIVLDIMLPVKDGIEVCRILRENGVNAPVIMLTARGELEDRVLGLDSGADDYLAKPFELDELLARIRALLRRPRETKVKNYKAMDIEINPSKHSVEIAGNKMKLTLKEYAVLEYLVLRKGMVLTREQILEHCWDHTYDSFSNIVDVYIKRIREKLGDRNEKYIQTIRGIGYSFQE